MVWCTHCAVKVFHCESNLQELDKTISESTPAKFSNAAWYGMQNTGRHTDFLAISTIELCLLCEATKHKVYWPSKAARGSTNCNGENVDTIKKV